MCLKENTRDPTIGRIEQISQKEGYCTLYFINRKIQSASLDNVLGVLDNISIVFNSISMPASRENVTIQNTELDNLNNILQKLITGMDKDILFSVDNFY